MRGCKNYTYPRPLPVLTCNETGVWNPSPPHLNYTCIPDDCPPIANIIHGTGCEPTPTPVGKTCTFSCNPGYRLVGQSTFECLFKEDPIFECNRSWQSAPLPVCTPITCNPSALTTPNNGFFENCQNVGLNQECRVICSPGYLLVPNNPVLRCTEFGWMPQTLPECQLIRCPPLVPVDNLVLINIENCRYFCRICR